MHFCCCFIREAVNRRQRCEKSIWRRNNIKVIRRFSCNRPACFKAPNALCSATGKKGSAKPLEIPGFIWIYLQTHLQKDAFQRLRVFLCCCKEDVSEEWKTSPSYLNTNASHVIPGILSVQAARAGQAASRTSGLKLLDQGCQTWGPCNPSGPFKADGFARSRRSKWKRLKENDSCVCFGDFVSRCRSYLQPANDITATL